MMQMGNRSASRRGSAVAKMVGLTVLAFAVVGLAAVFGIVGWSAVRQNWANGEPWFSGFQLAPLATPLAAFIAAGVAITTAKWGLGSARASRENDHQRWEADRKAERQRWKAERDAEGDRRRTERRDATERTLRDRFHELVKLLASEDLRAREGAAYAIDALSDDWKAHYGDEDPIKARAEQQVCVNVLIAQLRDPITESMGHAERAHLTALKQGVQKILASRLGNVVDGKVVPGEWSHLELVFDGCWFHNLDLSNRVLAGAKVSFEDAQFRGKWTSFDGTHFTGPQVSFERARFTGVRILFSRVRFAGQEVSFSEAHFSGMQTSFTQTQFESSTTWFRATKFASSYTDFLSACFSGHVIFNGTEFVGVQASFTHAEFVGGYVSLGLAHFASQDTTFDRVKFFTMGPVEFDGSHFIGHSVSFEDSQFGDTQTSFVDTKVMADEVLFGATTFHSLAVIDATASFSRGELSERTVDRFDDQGAKFDAQWTDCPTCELCSQLLAAMQGYAPM